MATCSPSLSIPSIGGSCHLFCRLNLTGRGSVPTPKTLLSLRLLCVSPSRQWQMSLRPLNTVTGMSLDHKKCHWIQYSNLSISKLSEWVSTHVPVFWHMQIKDHAKYLGVQFGPSAADHRLNKAKNNFVCVCTYPHFIAEPCSETRLFLNSCSVCPLVHWFNRRTRRCAAS